MNYLELSQRLVQEAGIAGGGPATTVSQSGIKKKVVDWIARAWTEIQNQRDWNFLWNTTSFTTTVGTRDYHPVTGLGLSPALSSYVTDSFLIYKTSEGVSDQGPLTYVPWGEWSNSFRGYGSVDSGKATEFTILPDTKIRLNANPDVSYTISFDYYRTSVVLAANSDTPALPTQYHEAIVYQALKYYAAHEDAPEIYQDADNNFNRLMADLLYDEQEVMAFAASPLA